MTYEIVDIVKLFGIGYGAGFILSVLPLIIGEVINLVFKTMKGGIN